MNPNNVKSAKHRLNNETRRNGNASERVWKLRFILAKWPRWRSWRRDRTGRRSWKLQEKRQKALVLQSSPSCCCCCLLFALSKHFTFLQVGRRGRERERALRFVWVVGVINRLIADKPNDNIIVIIISLTSQWPPPVVGAVCCKWQVGIYMQHAQNEWKRERIKFQKC